MNTTKIAALYADPIFNTLLRFPNFDPSTTLSKEVMAYVMRKGRVLSTDGLRYHVEASDNDKRRKYTDDLGERTGGFLSEYCTKRQADWMLRRTTGWPETKVGNYCDGLPKEAPCQFAIWGYGDEELGTDTLGCIRFGQMEDFDELLRAGTSIRNKRRKQAKKLEAQLRAYHRQQLNKQSFKEQHLLKNGHWLGAERALITAPRTDEPGVPFLGDAGLSDEQRQALGLRYWAVPADKGMSAAFPAGTGIALKVITSHKQLIDGAVYLSQLTIGRHDETGRQYIMRLGRLDKSRKEYGMIPLFQDDAPGKNLHVQAHWKPATPEQDYEVLLMQVMYYTTRNGALTAAPRLLSEREFLALDWQGQREQDALREELAAAA